LSFKNKNSFILKKTHIKKIIVAAISLFTLATLNGQAVEQSLPGAEEISNRRTSFNLEEIKVRWKKAALENCTVVPCIVTPPAPSFTCGNSTVADIDGNTYNTVLIGSQCWIKENLKVTKYNDGTPIPDETANTAGWAGLTTGARSIHTGYTGSSSYIATYGYLYNWYAATDNRKICPTGWHIPTELEWNSLFNSLGGILVAGGKMTYTGSSLWTGLTTIVDNSSGFTAIPGGYRSSLGSFFGIGTVAEFWGSSVNPSNSNNAFYFYIENGGISDGYLNKAFGNSIRCLKD
jgi:uncharacterized protein (TIGR02145 family)